MVQEVKDSHTSILQKLSVVPYPNIQGTQKKVRRQ